MKKVGRAIVLHERDNVATMLNDVDSGEEIEVISQYGTFKIKALNRIPFGHKVSLRVIREGERVVKYGEVIGVAVKNIQKGEHVHIHNLKSMF